MSKEIEDLDEYNQFLKGEFQSEGLSVKFKGFTIGFECTFFSAHDNLIVIAFFGSHVDVWKKMAPLYEEMAVKYNKTLFLIVSTLNQTSLERHKFQK